MNRILVIGATGNIGREVVSRLSLQGVPVRAMTRSRQSARFIDASQVVIGDFTVSETLDRCLDGIDSVFLVWTAAPAAIDAALERITKRARRIVFLTSPHQTAHPLFQQPNPVRAIHAHIERLIETSGLEWTFLRPGMFAANAVSWWAPQIRAGNVVHWPYATAPTAPIHESDIAAIALRALREDGHVGAEYVLTGPESLSQAEQVSLIGHAIGRSLRMEEISPDEAQRELLTIMPAAAATMLLSAWAAAVGQPAIVTSTFAEITGTPARTFLDWATDHASDFRA